MRIAREYVTVLARDLAHHLVEDKHLASHDARALVECIHSALAEELAVEDRINEEARAILSTHAAELQRLGGTYSEAFKKIKAELVRQKKGGALMRVSRDKVNQLAHVVTRALAARPEFPFLEDANSVRLAVRARLERMLAHEAKMDEAVRLKISSQKKGILEGSDEWEILYRKYYQEELKRLGA